MAQRSQYKSMVSAHPKADFQCGGVLIRVLSDICCGCEWQPSFPQHIWKGFRCLPISSTADDSIFSLLFFSLFSISVQFKQQFEAFFCLHFHFHVSFRKENTSRSRLSCKERSYGMRGPRLCPAVQVTFCSRGCAVRSLPTAGQLCCKEA